MTQVVKCWAKFLSIIYVLFYFFLFICSLFPLGRIFSPHIPQKSSTPNTKTNTRTSFSQLFSIKKPLSTQRLIIPRSATQRITLSPGIKSFIAENSPQYLRTIMGKTAGIPEQRFIVSSQRSTGQAANKSTGLDAKDTVGKKGARSARASLCGLELFTGLRRKKSLAGFPANKWEIPGKTPVPGENYSEIHAASAPLETRARRFVHDWIAARVRVQKRVRFGTRSVYAAISITRR